MKYNKLSTAILLCLSCVAITTVSADELISFSAGDVIKASDMNQNFKTLLQKFDSPSNPKVVGEYNVDCTDNTSALTEFMNTLHLDTFLIINLTGECHWSGFDLNRDAVLFKSGELTVPDGGNIIVGMDKIGFEQTTINNNITYDNGNGWLDGITLKGQVSISGGAQVSFNNMPQGINVMVESNSRLWVNNSMTFNELLVTGNSAFNANSEANIAANYIKVANGGYMGATKVTVDDTFNVRRGSNISVDELEVKDVLKLGENSTVLAVNAQIKNAKLFSGGHLTIEESLNIDDELFLKNGATAEGGSNEATLKINNLNASLVSSVMFNSIEANSIFSYANSGVYGNNIKATDEIIAERGGVIIADNALSSANLFIYGGHVEAQTVSNTSGGSNTTPALRIWEYGSLQVQNSSNSALNMAVCGLSIDDNAPLHYGYLDDNAAAEFPDMCNYPQE